MQLLQKAKALSRYSWHQSQSTVVLENLDMDVQLVVRPQSYVLELPSVCIGLRKTTSLGLNRAMCEGKCVFNASLSSSSAVTI